MGEGWGSGRQENVCKAATRGKRDGVPLFVRYDDGYWPHEFFAANSYLQRSSFDHLVEGTGSNAEFEAGVWCIVTQINDQD